jgi:hypothetical protein
MLIYEAQPAILTGAGDPQRLLMKLVTAVWETGTIPQQLGWVIVVLIPKGGGNYCGIGLLEPIWKIIDRLMDGRLKIIAIHESLHRCRDGPGQQDGCYPGKTGSTTGSPGATPILRHLL